MVKVPRFAFEKFPGADPTLTTHDEVGRRGDGDRPDLPRGAAEGAALDWRPPAVGFWTRPDPTSLTAEDALHAGLRCPRDGRLYAVERALRPARRSRQVARGHRDRPVVRRPDRALVELASRAVARRRRADAALLRRAKRAGLSDRQIAALRPELAGEAGVAGAAPAPRACGRCTRPSTPAPPSSRPARRTTTRPTSRPDDRGRAAQTERPKVIILGSGPNRIGQGIEFDYSCVHAAFALRDAGFETVMVNCNPETVSTDYDTADRLYFEPLTVEDVLEVVARRDGAAPDPRRRASIVQLGGQTPLKLAAALEAAGVPIVGTPPGGDRPRRGPRRVRPGPRRRRLPAPRYGTATSFDEARDDRRRDRLPGAGPALVRARRAGHGDRLRRRHAGRLHRPGHRGHAPTTRCWSTASSTTPSRSTSTRSATATGELYLGGVMEHIEEAGIHSGDSACALPPITLGARRDRAGPRLDGRAGPRGSACAG